MITTTLGALVAAHPALARIAAQPLPVKTAFAVARLVRAIEPEVQEFHRQRLALVKRYGTERPAANADEQQQYGETVTEIMNGHRPAFVAAINDLLVVTVEIDRGPLSLAEVPTISAADILALGPLAEELP